MLKTPWPASICLNSITLDFHRVPADYVSRTHGPDCLSKLSQMLDSPSVADSRNKLQERGLLSMCDAII
jgi:hypothetical protein